MLEKLTLSNFQTHKRLVLKLNSGVTTLMGTSDVGKTAVLRALRWLATNRPGGTAFTHHGAERVKVVLGVDGRTVGRVRSDHGNENSYYLDGKELKAFGHDVPTPVAQLLNLSPDNFQGQHDAPFWFSDSAGAVSRNLNQIINLGAIDETLAFLATRQRIANAAVEAAGERQTRAVATWRVARTAKQADAALQGVEQRAAQATAANASATLLNELLLQASGHAAAVDNALKRSLIAESAVAAGLAWKEVIEQRKALKEILSTHARWAAVVPPPNINPLLQAAADYRQAAEQTAALRAQVRQCDSLGERVAAESARAKEYGRQYKQQLGNRCPVCKSPLKTSATNFPT